MIKYLILIVATFLLFFGAVIFNWVFTESLYFDKKSMKYHVLLSDEIKVIPLFGKQGKETYYYGSGDGSKLGRVSVSYYTDLKKNDIIMKYKNYFSNEFTGLIKAELDYYIVTFAEKSDVYYFSIRKEGEKNKVKIVYFESNYE